MRRIPRVLTLFSVVAIGLGASACSGTAATPSPTAAQSVAAGTVAVTLSEWKVVPASATAAAGPITFAVTNSGSQMHEFVVVKTDLKADALPVADNKIDESTLTPVDEIEDIGAGTTPSLSVDLAAGHYVLLCNIETHYGQGMHADFDVN
ncbi:MAG: hypothetical protein ACTS8Z_08910 [Candidatus Limnocylindrales bacterium]